MRAAGVLCLTTLAAQAHPDFSGAWVLVPDSGSVGLPHRLIVEQNNSRTPATLTVRHDQSDSHPTVYDIGLVGGVVGGLADGAGAGLTDCGVVRFTTAVRWRDDDLIIENDRCSEDGTYSFTAATWELDADGRLVITTTERGQSASTPARTTTVVYRRE